MRDDEVLPAAGYDVGAGQTHGISLKSRDSTPANPMTKDPLFHHHVFRCALYGAIIAEGRSLTTAACNWLAGVTSYYSPSVVVDHLHQCHKHSCLPFLLRISN